MITLVFAILVSLQPASGESFTRSVLEGQAFYPPNHVSAPYRTELAFVLFPESGWTVELLLEHVRGLGEVYAQCGVEISRLSIFTPMALRLPPKLEKFDMEDAASILNLAAHAVDLPRPLVFLVGDFAVANNNNDPFSRASFTEMTAPAPPPLEATLWFPFHVNSQEYKEERKNSPYNVLAHELTHVLTLDGDHNNDEVPNLMTLYKRRSNRLTPEQCAEIVKSKFVRRTPFLF